MLYEYALEPSVLSTWQSFRYFLDKFGIGEGRLISKYPKHWKTMVWESCANESPLAKKRIEEKLDQMDRKLLKTKRSYRDDTDWVSNALDAHEIEPFHAVICRSIHELESVLVADDLDDTLPLWKVQRDGMIPRQAIELGAVVRSLLYHSTEIVFVDQHFGFTAKHGRPLTHFLAAARCGKNLTRVEYHLNAGVSTESFEEELKRKHHYLGLRNDEAIVFVRWKCIDGGENQHPRYVLTNRGGVRFDYGLDEGDGTTDWSLLGEELWQQRKEQFAQDKSPFEWVDAWKVTQSGVARVGWKNGAWSAIVHT
jgi:hypothetical protein